MFYCKAGFSCLCQADKDSFAVIIKRFPNLSKDVIEDTFIRFGQFFAANRLNTLDK
jgi:hypothetical protein